MRRALTLAGALLALAAPAQARPSAATVRLDKAVTLAEAYWSGDACQPQAWIGDADWSEFDGVSIASSCAWGLPPTWPRWRWARLCPVVVHEFGHLAGHGHTDDPRSVMSAEALGGFPEICGRRPRRTPVSMPAREAS